MQAAPAPRHTVARPLRRSGDSGRRGPAVSGRLAAAAHTHRRANAMTSPASAPGDVVHRQRRGGLTTVRPGGPRGARATVPGGAARSTSPGAAAADVLAAPDAAPDAAPASALDPPVCIRAPPGSHIYFAFGSNVNTKTFSGVRGIQPSAAYPAVLPGYRLVFNVPGLPYFEPAFASVKRLIPGDVPAASSSPNDRSDDLSRYERQVHGMD